MEWLSQHTKAFTYCVAMNNLIHSNSLFCFHLRILSIERKYYFTFVIIHHMYSSGHIYFCCVLVALFRLQIVSSLLNINQKVTTKCWPLVFFLMCVFCFSLVWGKSLISDNHNSKHNPMDIQSPISPTLSPTETDIIQTMFITHKLTVHTALDKRDFD